jgi:hypothetical protein
MSESEEYEIMPVRHASLSSHRNTWSDAEEHAISPVSDRVMARSLEFAREQIANPEVKRVIIGEARISVRETITTRGVLRRKTNKDFEISVETPQYVIEKY